MNKYFEGKVKYRKVDANGAYKAVTEAYIVDALSFTEAEARLNELMSQYISEEFKITNIRVTNFAEVHASEGDNWFKSKVCLLAYCEESGKEKKTNIYFLVQANDVKEAHDKTVEVMKTTLGEYTIPSVSETNIIEVFEYITEGFVAE